MEEQNIYFKIISNKNKNVYCEGYVAINGEDDEDVDWYYWTDNGYQQQGIFIWHNEEEITGLTDEQYDEIDQFQLDYDEDAFWIDTVILQSEENENETYVRKNCTLIINEGANCGD